MQIYKFIASRTHTWHSDWCHHIIYIYKVVEISKIMGGFMEWRGAEGDLWINYSTLNC